MKNILSLTFLSLTFIFSSCGMKPYVPQPMREMEDLLKKDDSVEWVQLSKEIKMSNVEYTYTHKGDTTSNWVEHYKRAINISMKPDMKAFIEAKNQEISDNNGFNSFSSESIGSDNRMYFIEYEIGKYNEIGMIILFREIDGLYFQSWQYRSKDKDKARVNAWRKRLKGSRTFIGKDGFKDF